MAHRSSWALAVVLLLRCCVELTHGHGRLLDPPSRSSMWRMGYQTPKNYNDNELFCGGLTRQQRNGMKCGICGDPFDLKTPRANEMGGVYYSGIISRHYDPGQVIKAIVELTANHNGFFEFHICRVNGNASLETEECLQHTPLEVIGEGRLGTDNPYRYKVPRPVTGKYAASLKLPSEFSCDHCVFQWTYTAGNNWGNCGDGRHAVGCGPQETFRGCADIAIGAESATPVPTVHSGDPQGTSKPPPSPQPFTPSVMTPWNHWLSTNAWPHNVNPGYPGEPNRTTWFYHQWPNPVRFPATSTLSAPTELFDLKVPHGSTDHGHRWSGVDSTTTNLAQPPDRSIHVADRRNPSRDWSEQTTRWPYHQESGRRFKSHSIASGVASPHRDRVQEVESPTRSRIPQTGSRPTFIEYAMPPVVLVEAVENEVLTNPLESKKSSATPGTTTCSAAGLYANVPGMTDWCNLNCFSVPRFCPESHCACA